MRRLTRSLLLFLALLLLPDLARGQFAGPPSYGLVGTMLNLADESGIPAELKATDDQVRALVAIRQNVWDKLYTLTPSELAKRIPTERPEVETAVRKVVTPEQYTRLRQLAVRSLVGSAPLGDSLAAERAPRQLYAFDGSNLGEIHAALKIEPRKGPGGFPGMTPRLTFEQRQALLALMGPPFRGRASVAGPLGAYDDRFSGFLEVPVEIDFLDSPEVRKALGVAKAAEPKLAALLERWEKETQALGVGSYFLSSRMGIGSHGPGGSDAGPDLSLEQKKQKIDKLVADLRAEATALVGADAMKRTRQIGNQHSARMDGSPKVGVYNQSHLDEDLKLTRSQRDALIRVVGDAHVRAVAGRVDLDRPADAVLRDLAEEEKATVAKAEAILTPEQRARLKAEFGEPFAGELTFDYQQRDGGIGDPEAAKAQAAATFGRWTAGELYGLTQPAFQTELKLTDKQKEQADAAVRKYREEHGRGGGFGPMPDGWAEKADAFIRQQVAAVLTAEQQARFLELAIQHRQAQAKRQAETPFFGNAWLLASGLPGVADKLGVTAEQKKALLDGKPEGKVLTDAQAKKLTELAGVPAKADLLVPGPGVGGPVPGSASGIVTMPTPYHLLLEPVPLGGGSGFGGSGHGVEVEEELKLSADQRQELAKLADRRTAAFKGLHRQAREERQAATDAANKADAAAIDKLLSPEQRKRLDQLALQVEAGTSLGAVLVAEAGLKLSADQKQAIQKVREQARDRAKLLEGKVGMFPASMVVGMALRDKLDEALLAALTPEQRTAWQARVGPPAAGLRKQPVPIGGHGPGGGLGFGGRGEPPLP